MSVDKKYNFSVGSQRDTLVNGCLRPGKQSNNVEEPNSVTKEQVDEWVNFMKANDIKCVLSLLGMFC